MEEKKLYSLMYGYLAARIYFKSYPEGEFMPSIYTLSELFGVSTMTVRGALRLLEQEGYISNAENKRSVILQHSDHTGKGLPNEILAQEAVLRDLYESLKLLFPDMFYYGLSLCGARDIQEQRNILDRPAPAWDEPIIHFLAKLIKKLNNSIMIDLYYDVLLFSYPTYIASLSEDQSRRRTSYHLLHDRLKEMLLLKENGDKAALRSLINQTYMHFDTYTAAAPQEAFHDSVYSWGKPHLCLSIANELIRRIFIRFYPIGTFLPSARILSEEFCIPTITMRRAILFLNNLGVVESINGKGTRILSPEEGLKKIKWNDSYVRKNIISCLESLHVLALTCRSMAEAIFPLISKDDLKKMKEELIMSEAEYCASTVPAVCYRTMVSAVGLSSLKVIIDRLFSFLIWGFPLFYLDPLLKLDSSMEQLIQSLETDDPFMFGNAMEQFISAMFLCSRSKAISVGINEAENLILPFCEDIS